MVLLVVGGKMAFGADQKHASAGLSMTRASIVLFTLLFFIQAILTVYLFIATRTWAGSFEVLILSAILAATPILEVRIIYGCILFFDPTNSEFGFRSQSILVQVGMVALPEMLVTLIALEVGWKAPPRQALHLSLDNESRRGLNISASTSHGRGSEIEIERWGPSSLAQGGNSSLGLRTLPSAAKPPAINHFV
jgi:hypothetical protein